MWLLTRLTPPFLPFPPRMNLCLPSSLLTPVAADSLSSYYRRLSSLAAFPASHPPSSLPPVPLVAGDVLEVHGGSSTGKSAVLLSCVLSCALPLAVSGLTLHGCDRSCVILDCDGRLSVYRLQCMLEERCSKAWQQHWEAVASAVSSPEAGEDLRAAASRNRRHAVSLLTQVVLRRLRVVQVADEVELMAALLTVDRMCEAEQVGGALTQYGSDEQQRQQQLHNISPYLHDRQRPLFHNRDEESQQLDDVTSLSHGRSIACLPLPQPRSTSSSPSPSSTSSPVPLISRFSPVSPAHSLSLHSPDPLLQARQPLLDSSSSARDSPIQLSAVAVPSASSVSEVLSALSDLCVSTPPPVELLLIDNVGAFYFSAKTADRLSAASASSPATGSTAPTVYSSLSSRLRRVLLDRQLAAVVSKPTLFAGTASSLQSEWKHSEYLPPEYSAMVRWRLLLRMKAEGGRMMEDDEQDHSAPHSCSAVDEDDSGGLRECRLMHCRDEREGGGARQAKQNTVSFHSTFTHTKEGIVFV